MVLKALELCTFAVVHVYVSILYSVAEGRKEG
jgi:hypothetical protein